MLDILGSVLDCLKSDGVKKKKIIKENANLSYNQLENWESVGEAHKLLGSVENSFLVFQAVNVL